jgi:hypothetical protein
LNRKKVFLTAQSILCVILAVILITAALGIYREGLVQKASDPLSWIYSREKAAAALRPVLPLLALGLLMAAIGLVMGSQDENGKKPMKDMECLRDLTVSRTAVASAEMKAEQTRQKKLLYGGWAVFTLCMIPILLYITNGDHFPNGDLEPVFLELIGHVLPWIAIGLAALMVSTVLQEKSMLREIEAAKEQIKLEKNTGAQPEMKREEKKKPVSVRTFRVALLVLALILIVAGVFNGSAKDVFGKAVKICTECVGLG